MNPYTPSQEQVAYEKASRRVNELRKFYVQLIVYGIVMVLFSYFITTPGKKIFFLIFGIWGAVIIVRAIKIFLFGNNWQQKKINEILNKQNK